MTDAATGQALQSLLAMSTMIPPLSSVCTDQSLWPWSSSFSFILVSSSLICPKEKSTESYQWPHLHPRWQAKQALWYGSGPSLYTYSGLRLWKPELGKLVTNMKQSACNKFKWKNELWWAMGSSTEGLWKHEMYLDYHAERNRFFFCFSVKENNNIHTTKT